MTKLIDSNIGPASLANAHPSIDLARAVRRLLDLKKSTNKTHFTKAELKHALGFAEKSGAASPVISALIHFGFLKKDETGYVYTELANTLSAVSTESKEYRELLLLALSSPELYGWLNDRYGEDLPDEIDTILIGKYHHRNVTEKNAKSIIANYLKSIDFVKSAGKISSSETGADEYIQVNFINNTVPIYKKYLLEAIEKTRKDEQAKINESLK